MRKYGRLDTNQKEIVNALRLMGATVQSLASLGKGCPDLLVGYRGRNILLEVKDGKAPPNKRALTDEERKWIQLWKGQCVVVETVIAAMAAVKYESEELG